MIIAWTRPAIGDLRALRSHIARDNPKAAEETALKILHTVERLVDFPASGRPGAKPYTRELIVPGTPYFAVYRVKHEVVEILRVIHGARRWP